MQLAVENATCLCFPNYKLCTRFEAFVKWSPWLEGQMKCRHRVASLMPAVGFNMSWQIFSLTGVGCFISSRAEGSRLECQLQECRPFCLSGTPWCAKCRRLEASYVCGGDVITSICRSFPAPRETRPFVMQDAVGAALVEIFKVTPDGVLVFLPSYKLLTKLCDRWRFTGLWLLLSSHKQLFIGDHKYHATVWSYPKDSSSKMRGKQREITR